MKEPCSNNVDNQHCGACQGVVDKPQGINVSVSTHAGADTVALSERNHYTTKFRQVLEQVFQLARGAKTADYGETWKRVGLMGQYIKIFIKEGRLRELVWAGKTAQVKGESIKDTLIDIAAYAVYAVICLDEDNLNGDKARGEHLVEMRSAINREIEAAYQQRKGW